MPTREFRPRHATLRLSSSVVSNTRCRPSPCAEHRPSLAYCRLPSMLIWKIRPIASRPLNFSLSSAIVFLVFLCSSASPTTRSSVTPFFLLVFLPATAEAMRLVVQRVKSASVTVDGSVVSSIGPGAMALVGVHENDTQRDLEYCCKRLLGCKLWDNGTAPWRHGVKQKGFEVLCVSQFTLYGKLTKKNQPDYKAAMKNVPAQKLYKAFLDLLSDCYESEKIHDGVFGAMMDVSLVNDGPVTIIIESVPGTGEAAAAVALPVTMIAATTNTEDIANENYKDKADKP